MFFSEGGNFFQIVECYFRSFLVFPSYSLSWLPKRSCGCCVATRKVLAWKWLGNLGIDWEMVMAGESPGSGEMNGKSPNWQMTGTFWKWLGNGFAWKWLGMFGTHWEILESTEKWQGHFGNDWEMVLLGNDWEILELTGLKFWLDDRKMDLGG